MEIMVLEQEQVKKDKLRKLFIYITVHQKQKNVNQRIIKCLIIFMCKIQAVHIINNKIILIVLLLLMLLLIYRYKIKDQFMNEYSI